MSFSRLFWPLYSCTLGGEIRSSPDLIIRFILAFSSVLLITVFVILLSSSGYHCSLGSHQQIHHCSRWLHLHIASAARGCFWKSIIIINHKHQHETHSLWDKKNQIWNGQFSKIRFSHKTFLHSCPRKPCWSSTKVNLDPQHSPTWRFRL